MEQLISHLLESALCLAGFYLFYRVALRSETCFSPTRWYLMASVPISLLIPALTIPGPWQSPATTDLWMQSLSGVQVMDLTNGEPTLKPMLTPLAWTLIIIYALGLGFFASRLIHQLALMNRLVQLAKVNGTSWQGIPVINTDGQLPTFAFGKYLFFDNTLKLSDTERDHILQHESVHIRQRHTVDVLVMEVFQVFLWFNPIVHLIKRGLSETHEFLADAEVIKTANHMAYGRLLAKQVLYQMDLTLGSYFNKAQVFKRLEMLKLRKYHTSKKRFRLLIPLTAIMLGVFSCEKTDAWITEPLPETLRDVQVEELGRLDVFILQDENGFNSPKEFVEIHDTRLRARVGDLSVEIEGIQNSLDRQRALEFVANLRKEVEITAAAVPTQPKPDLDQAPRIKGGQDALGQLMAAEMIYPEVAQEAGLEGKVYVSFVLTKSGKVLDPEVVQSPEILPGQGRALEAIEIEAVRGIKATSGQWHPAIKDGEPIHIRLVVPVTFSL